LVRNTPISPIYNKGKITLNQTIESLRKVLKLEQAKGYSDKAVMGGLDRFLHNLSPPDEKLSHLLSPNYSALDTGARERWIKNILGQIDSGGLKAQPPPKTIVPKQKPLTPNVKRDNGQSLDTSITSIKGINSSLASKFDKLGVKTVRELIYFFPRRHIDYSRRKLISELEVGAEQTIIATIWEAAQKGPGYRKRNTEAVVGDESGNIRVIWFNQPYLAKKLTTNSQIVLSGRVGEFKGRKVFQSPEWELLESDDLIHTGRLVPVYPLTAGLYPRTMRRLVKGTLDRWLPELTDFLPENVKESAGLLPLPEAISQAHYPDSELSKDRARKRLAFDELFLIQLGVLAKKRDWQEEGIGNAFNVDNSYLEPFFNSLPFKLTSAQRRILAEIQRDLSKPKPMSRLLQGEVGSGKTVVATAAMLLAAANGYQAALMAPTEILAEQHFNTICGLLSRAGGESSDNKPVRKFSSMLPRPISVGLIIGGLKESSKQELQERVSAGEVDIIIGTHALIQKGVDFQSLGLCVVDEQHRFGVMQRAMLRSKGSCPHVLVMSATPIPRTLALTLYGDLDLSVLDELPPGRVEIKTKFLSPEQRQKAYDFVRKQVAEERQAFIICPLIEESEAIETKAAITEYEHLSQSVFPDLRLGLLHGRLNSAEKDEVMQRFRSGELDILVSTPVVEVGVDVPNATVMLIEGADRFGLAQLHQFRGRVGRGRHQSYCLLLAETPSAEAKERLKLLESIRNGFKLAEEDLRIRGPGEFFGTRQSGLPDLKMAKLSDVELLELARREAIRLFEADPYLQREEHKLLAREVNRLWNSEGELS
jgi:ATP-dependent DNA helicase RecG